MIAIGDRQIDVASMLAVIGWAKENDQEFSGLLKLLEDDASDNGEVLAETYGNVESIIGGWGDDGGLPVAIRGTLHELREAIELDMAERIEKDGSEVVLKSSDGSKVLGRFPFGAGKKYATEKDARDAALKRERQIQFFKNKEAGTPSKGGVPKNFSKAAPKAVAIPKTDIPSAIADNKASAKFESTTLDREFMTDLLAVARLVKDGKLVIPGLTAKEVEEIPESDFEALGTELKECGYDLELWEAKAKKKGGFNRGLIRLVGRIGFRGCIAKFGSVAKTPQRFCGKLKALARAAGVLSKAHGGGKGGGKLRSSDEAGQSGSLTLEEIYRETAPSLKPPSAPSGEVAVQPVSDETFEQKQHRLLLEFEQRKQPRADVNYVIDPGGDELCKNCAFFLLPDMCKLVKGPLGGEGAIRPQDRCDLWENVFKLRESDHVAESKYPLKEDVGIMDVDKFQKKERRRHISVDERHALSDGARLEIVEAEQRSETGPLMVKMTLIGEGPGNRKHKNYYTRRAVESAMDRVMRRPKMYIDHIPGEKVTASRPLRDWAASVRETWTEEQNGVLYGRAKVAVMDPWLKERINMAPEEIGVSIEGRGVGHYGSAPDGKDYNLVEEVKWLNAFNFVDYTGNAPMGVAIMEGDMGELTLEQFKEQYAELYAEWGAQLAGELREQLTAEITDKVKADVAAGATKTQTEEGTEETETLKQAKVDAEKRAEAAELKLKISQREALVERELSESRLPKIAITDHFRRELKEMVIHAESDEAATESLKRQIEDRRAITSVHGAPQVVGMGGDGQDPDEDIQKMREALDTTLSFGGVVSTQASEKEEGE